MPFSKQNISPVSMDPGSFRDPSGFTFIFENEIYRAIAPSYFENFSLLLTSGLYQFLSEKRMIIEHSEAENFLSKEYSSYKVIKQKKIPFISYPYEWCFSQLKDAALLTLQVLKESLSRGMILKDASSYNIQFINCKPVFIDTLSFEKYQDGKPWNAYRQFCQHFLAPLALMHYKSADLSKLLMSFIDGLPLGLVSPLLPAKAMINTGVASHILLHSKIQKKYMDHPPDNITKTTLSRTKLLSLIEHMEDCISGLNFKAPKTNWINYTEENTYPNQALHQKEQTVSGWLKKIKSKTVWDFGCNTGNFSFIASGCSEHVLSVDSDHCCIENFYSDLKKRTNKNILPLVMDLASPSPAIGWANKERKTLAERGKADSLLALALLHHLTIGNNIPFSFVAKYFFELTEHLIIEFVPAVDFHVKQMISGRENIFNNYSLENFISEFEKYFVINERQPLADSGRILFNMSSKTPEMVTQLN